MATTRPRERILDAATRLFADEGINATSVDRVIAEADVAPMTVYRKFGGKDELVAATVEQWSVRWLAWLRDESWTDTGAPGARLEGLWDALEKWFADDRDAFCFARGSVRCLELYGGGSAEGHRDANCDGLGSATAAPKQPWRGCESGMHP